MKNYLKILQLTGLNTDGVIGPDISLLRFSLLKIFFCEPEQPIFHPGQVIPSYVVFTPD